MRSIPGTLGLTVTLLLAASCGPAPEPQQPSGGSSTAKPGDVAAPMKGLPPAPEPSDLVATVRWKNPTATMTAAATCAGVPGQFFDAGLKMGVDEVFKDALRGAADIKALAGLVAYDAPVDAVVSLDPKSRRPDALAAVAIGLTSLERAKQAVEASGPATELAPGVWRIGGKERRRMHCAIAAATGGPPARLVCGDREKDLTALAAYMARTLPATPSAATDLHGEARLAPVDKRFGGELRTVLRQLPMLVKGEAGIGEPRFDDALVEAATATQEEVVALLSDLDRVTVDVAVTPGSCTTTGTGTLQLKGKKSWIAASVTDRPERQGPPPAIFWRAPKDSDSAFFSRGTDPARYTRILKVLRALTEGFLTKNNVGSAADRKALADIINLPLGKDTNSVQASGHIEPPAAKPGAKPGAKPSTQQGLDSLMTGMMGWHLLGVDEGPEAISKFLKDFVAIYNRASLQAPLKKALKDDAKMLPSVKSVPAPKELGAGAMAMEIKFTEIKDPTERESFDPKTGKLKKSAPKKKLTMVVHLLLMADDKNTWLGFGTKKDELVKRLLGAKASAGDANALASRPGLESLKSTKNMSAGFFSLTPLVEMVRSAVEFAGTVDPDDKPPPQVMEMVNTLRNLPNKGQTPIVLQNQVTAGAAPKAQLSLALPKGAAEDLAKIAITAATLANSLTGGGAMPPAPPVAAPPPPPAPPAPPPKR